MSDTTLNDIYEELDELYDSVENQKFESSYTNRRTYGKINYMKPVVVIFSIVGLMLFFLFARDEMIDVDVEDLVSVKTTSSVERGKIIEQVKQQQEEAAQEVTLTANLSMADVPHYELEIPYTLSYEDIGGYSTGLGTDVKMKEDRRVQAIGGLTAFTRFGSLEGIAKSDYHIILRSEAEAASYDETGCAQIDGRYLASIGQYFFPNSKKYVDFSLESNGYCYDAILKNGTVIPFIKFDSKSTLHTNNGQSNSTYSKSELKLSSYSNIFQCRDGSIIEIVGKQDGDCLNNLNKKYGHTKDNPIVKVVMYNKKYK
jgi:hypothetical protein